MKKKFLVLYLLFLVSYSSFAQGVGIGTVSPDVSAALDITATNKGLLIPRMSITSVNAIANPAKGLLVYDSLANQLLVNIGTPALPNWQPVSSNGGGWLLTGNAGTDQVNQFIGTTDNKPLRFRIDNKQAGELHPQTGNISWGFGASQFNTSGFSNIAIGTDALKLNTQESNLVAIGDSALFHNGQNNPVPGALGISNTAIGSKSLFSNTLGGGNTATGTNSLFANTEGSDNTAYGVASLFSNTIGNLNTGIGVRALFSNTTGNLNTAVGWESLKFNTIGVFNTGFGSFSLTSNTTGENNTALGYASLNSNTTGQDNTATGIRSLFSNTVGTNNVATGNLSLFTNTTGIGNTAAGTESLFFNTTGGVNTAIGNLSLFGNTTGNSNTAVGVQSLFLNTTGGSNTAVGGNALGGTTSSFNNTVVGFNAGFDFNLGSGNTIIGAGADAGGDGAVNSVAIGKDARCTADNQVRFGNSSTTSIGGIVGFTNLSDGRYKRNVQEKVKGIDFIMKLRPVTYQLDMTGLNQKLNHGKKPIDQSEKSIDENSTTVFTGFVAQEVEQAAKASGFDFSGIDKPKNESDLYGLRYSEFVVPLVKAMQEQQKMIEELRMQNAELIKRMVSLEKNK